jgi:hypothetical protein
MGASPLASGKTADQTDDERNTLPAKNAMTGIFYL